MMFFHLCSALTASLSLLLAQIEVWKEDCACVTTDHATKSSFSYQTWGNPSGLTFRQTELLQLTGQRFTVNIMLCCTGENEAEHCHTRFDVPALCKMD